MDSRDLRNLEEEYKKISGSAEQLDENPILDFLSKMSPPASQSANPNVRSGVRTPGLVNKGNPIPRQGDLSYRIQRALPKALADIPRAIPAQLRGQDNAASLRQQARAQKLMTLLRTGKIDDTIKPGEVGTTGATNNNNNRGGNLLKGLSIGPGGFNINGKPVKTGGGSDDGGGGAPKGTSPANATTAQKIQGGLKTYAQQRTTNPTAAKATGDAVFKLAQQRIAAANAERARIRGTSQTDNPLMRDLRSKLSNPTTPTQDPKLKKLVGKTSGYQSLLKNPNIGPTSIKSDVDMFDIVKGHLISEGATEKEALKRMVSMTEQEINTILQNINI